MKRDDMLKPPKSVTDLLKACTIIGTIGTVGAIILFIMTCLGDPREKMLTMTGVLAVLVCLYTFLSNRAYQTAASGTAPRMRYLVALTLFNLLVLGLPLSWFGFMAMIFGVGIIGDSPTVATLFNLLVLGLPLIWFGFMAMIFGVGIIGDSATVALVLVFLALCAVLFFISHIMTLVAATKIRRLHA